MIAALIPLLFEQIERGRLVASLTIGAVIVPDRQEAEGVLLKSCANLWLEVVRHLGADWSLAFTINPRVWEELLAGAFVRDGFRVTLTPRSGDRGRDVIAIKDGFGSVRILGSMKAYGPDHLVTREHVHEMLGVITADQGATKGIIATTSDFAPKVLADDGLRRSVPYRLELLNGIRLQQWLKKLVDR
jgi:restriction system protein